MFYDGFYRLALTESELALTEQKASDYNMLINKLKQELSGKMGDHQEELRRFQEVDINGFRWCFCHGLLLV